MAAKRETYSLISESAVNDINNVMGMLSDISGNEDYVIEIRVALDTAHKCDVIPMGLD